MSLTNHEFTTLDQKTASGNSEKWKIPALTMLLVAARITASSGTSPTMGLWLQWSPDGTNWYDLPYDAQLTKNTAAADLTANTSKRNINGTALATGASLHTALYRHVPAGYLRAIWVFGGTTPTFTFEVQGDAK